MSTDGSNLGYAELLRLAVAKGLQELDVTVLQIPSEASGGHAVVLATARTGSGLFRSVGEAWWSESAGAARPQALLVAESRAKTRVLCEAVGMPQAGLEQPARPSIDNNRAVPASARPAVPVPAETRSFAREAAQTPPAAPPPARPRLDETPPGPQAASGDAPSTSAETAESPAPRPRVQPAAKAAPRPLVSPAEGLGPDVLQKLMHMTRRISELKQEDLSEEEALAKLDSFFMRAFNHPLAEGTRVEGQRVVQRLASDLARLSQESPHEAAG